jgi:hypothetical protein
MPTVLEIIQQSWIIYEENFKKLLKIILWGFLASSLTTGLIFIIGLFFTGNEWAKFILEFLAGAPQILVAIWMTVSLIDAANDLLLKKRLDVKKSMRTGFKLYIPTVIVSSVVAFIQAIGFMLFIIPGFIFSVWFAFAVYETVIERKKLTESMKESKKLSAGRWWNVAWLYYAPGIFWGLAGWLATAILFFSIKQIYFLTKVSLDPFYEKIMALFITICQNAFYVFFVPPIILSVAILYKNLKKEGAIK